MTHLEAMSLSLSLSSQYKGTRSGHFWRHVYASLKAHVSFVLFHCSYIMVWLFTRTDSSKFMDSKMRPLWCVWQNQDESGHDINMMYKNGDGRLVFLFTRQTPSYRRTQKMFSVRVVVKPCCRDKQGKCSTCPCQIDHTNFIQSGHRLKCVPCVFEK